jgi:hypothetical protein
MSILHGPRVVYVVDVAPGNFLNAWKRFHADRYERTDRSFHLACGLTIGNVVHVAAS